MANALAVASDLGFFFPPAPSSTPIATINQHDDKNVAHLTHVSEMEKKCGSLARITAILKEVIQNKKQFSELLLKAASDYEALTASVVDFQWSQNFREAPSFWGCHASTAVCGPSSLPVTPAKYSSQGGGEPECVTPSPWREEVSSDDLLIRSDRERGSETQGAEEDEENQLSSLTQSDIMSQRRLSWPPPVKKTYKSRAISLYSLL